LKVGSFVEKVKQVCGGTSTIYVQLLRNNGGIKGTPFALVLGELENPLFPCPSETTHLVTSTRIYS
jgi:hypothetical protein